MKKFIEIENPKPKRGCYIFDIYKIKYNELIYIGEGSLCYGAMRGETSEVMNRLIELGEIPKKYKGYYNYSNGQFKITYRTFK